MTDWKSILKEDPTEWLLERENPSVRYFTLIDLLDKPANDPEVVKTKREIMKAGVVPRILSKQEPGGYWGIAEDFYIRSKYKGTVWQLIILAELEASGEDRRIKKACEFILENSQDRQSGGFAYCAVKIGGAHSKVVPCLTGNMVCSLIRFGYFEDPRVQQGIDWIAKFQRFDDGIKKAPEGWPYDKRERCWGTHTCHMGAVKVLKALSEIPPYKRSNNVEKKIEAGAEYMLTHHVHKRSHDLNKVSKPSWLQFGFPLMWNTDALEILGVLTRLGYKDRRMYEAIDLILSKQDQQGKWLLENTFNGRFLINIEQKGKPSKWITLNALKVLKRWFD